MLFDKKNRFARRSILDDLSSCDVRMGPNLMPVGGTQSYQVAKCLFCEIYHVFYTVKIVDAFKYAVPNNDTICKLVTVCQVLGHIHFLTSSP